MSAAARKNKPAVVAPAPTDRDRRRRLIVMGTVAAGATVAGLAAIGLAGAKDAAGAGASASSSGNAGSPAAGAASAAPAPLTAQTLRAGEHYVEVSPAIVVAQAAGRIEVIEFFWYGCPHCYALEPDLHKWIRELPPQAAFRRVPVGFAAAHRAHQRLFYTMLATGDLPRLHGKVFEAIHVQRRMLLSEEDVLAFMVANGVSQERWQAAAQDPKVERLAREAKVLSDSYELDGVPALAVAGRYYTSGTKAGDNLRALQVARLLVDKALS